MDAHTKPWILFLKKPLSSCSVLLCITLAVLGLTWIQTMQSSPFGFLPWQSTPVSSVNPGSCASLYQPNYQKRKFISSIKDFGGIGDGITSNTQVFRKAVREMSKYGNKGGAQLNVPVGTWLTGSFNLTSNFTLFLEDGAVILGSQDMEEWPLIEPLPSYGRGRERLGPRHVSLIHGNGLNDVVITGNNGRIDGQGRMWWELWWNRTLNYTRGHLVEISNSNNILISNLTFLNSPFWTIHPVYCSNVVIRNMTILAPLNSPNTDGIDPDSSTNVCIEDCHIESGDDLVAIKSGWDQYGIKTARPSSNVTIQRITGTTPTCSGIGIGSEMSGGISNVYIKDINIYNCSSAVRLKTDVGRGGYITNVTIKNVTMRRVKIPIRFSHGANDHPDENFDPNAVPRVSNICVSNIFGENISRAPVLLGVEGAVYERVYMRNVSFRGVKMKEKWNCEFVQGEVYDVFPPPCEELVRSNGSSSVSSWCRAQF
ncbi:hypothetical protein LUZ60_015955 [Juncus effusus]|nr:hypothetical protein LUZ60_015955 [Juncus effusus]